MIIFLGATIFSFFASSLGLLFKQKWGFKKKNYLGRKVFFPAGLLLPLSVYPIFLIIIKLQILDREFAVLAIFYSGSVLLGGIIDDLWGQEQIKGFKGHIKELLSGSISTGILKIITAVLGIAPLAAYLAKNWFAFLSYFFLGLLVINVFNSLDLRPGRCLKGLIFFLLLLSPWMFGKIACLLMGTVLGHIYFDLKQKMMLGDSGAGYLGSLAAILLIQSGQDLLIFIFTILFLLFNLFTELRSISGVIDNNRVLQNLDLWGR